MADELDTTQLIEDLGRAKSEVMGTLKRLTKDIDRLNREVTELERQRAQAVRRARTLGITWLGIGKMVGMTPQGAHQRWWPKGSSS